MRPFKDSVAKLQCHVKSGTLEVHDTIPTGAGGTDVTSVSVGEDGAGYFFLLDDADKINMIPIGFAMTTKNGAVVVVSNITFIAKAAHNPESSLSPFGMAGFTLKTQQS